MIVYEFPCNEHIRCLLRLETLFGKARYFSRREHWQDHHIALEAIFDILDVVGRSDPKVSLVQELERQRQLLLQFRNNPKISEEALNGSLYEIEQATTALIALNGRFGQALRDNAWLMSLKNKSTLPGGACGFDLPFYHYWLSMPPHVRKNFLEQLQKNILPAQSAIELILRLLRASGARSALVAKEGLYQQTLNGASFQLARIELEDHVQAIPEISANRYALNIRFILPAEAAAKAQCVSENVEFFLSFCSLNA
ncbi:MAG: cell division protein ZapD [Zoogloeaceae bacterium]|nr:cell division protein ZapD [Zoogloeaceae bacterium]